MTAADLRARRRCWLFDFDAQGGPAGRRGARLHRRRRDLRPAARLDAAPAAGAHARGRVRPQRPGRRAARDRLHRVDQAARLRPRRRRCCCSSSSSASASSSASRVGWARRPGRSGARSSRPPASTRSPRWRRPRWPSAAPTRCTARASSPSTSPGWCSAPARSPPSRRSPPSTRAWPGSRSSAMFLTLGLLVFPSPARRRRGRGHRARARGRRRRAAAGGRSRRRCSRTSRGASASSSAGPACAARCRSCSRPSR